RHDELEHESLLSGFTASLLNAVPRGGFPIGVTGTGRPTARSKDDVLSRRLSCRLYRKLNKRPRELPLPPSAVKFLCTNSRARHGICISPCPRKNLRRWQA